MNAQSINMNIDTGEKTWLTPPHIIEALGPFDLDPCCPPTMPWHTATRMVHWPDDGLKVDWTGKRVWCNPPYGREAIPFLRKMAENRTGGGYFAYICAYRHFGVARLDIPIRSFRPVFARTHQILSPRRGARRGGYGTVCARCVLGAGFCLPTQQRSCRGVFAHMEAMTYERDYRPVQH